MIVVARAGLFLGACLFVFWSWLGVVRAFGKPRSGAEEALFASVLGFAQVLAWAQLLGYLSILHFRFVSVANLATALVLTLVARGRRNHAQEPVPDASPPSAESLDRWPLRVMRILAALAFVILIVLAGALPPVRYDELAYHLPMVAAMRQDHSLLFAPMNRPTIDGYPKHVEIWFFHVLEAFGSDRWVEVAQLPFALVGMLGVYTLARRFGAAKPSAALAAWFFPFSPVVLSQLRTAYVDVAASSLIVASTALARIAARDRDKVALGAFGAALGLTIGSKGSGPMYALLVGAAFIIWLRAESVPWRMITRISLPVGAGAVLLGASNFVKDWFVYGNPLYPMQVRLGPLLVFEGPRDVANLYGQVDDGVVLGVLRLLRSWIQVTESRHSALLGGFGLTWVFLLPCWLWCIVRAARARDVSRLTLYLLPAALLAVTPVAYRVRFVLFLLGFGCVALSELASQLSMSARQRLMRATPIVAGIALLHAYAFPLINHVRAAVRGKRTSDLLITRCVPEAHRSAIRALRALATADSRTLVVEDGSPEQFFAYCFWNDQVTNWVSFRRATDFCGQGLGREASAKPSLVSPHGPTYWYVPRTVLKPGCLDGVSRAFDEIYADTAAVIMRQKQ